MEFSYWLPDMSGLRWMTSSDSAWDWIVTRGCWWRVLLWRAQTDPDTRHCTQHPQMSTAATTGSEFVAICGIWPPSIPSPKFGTPENNLLISRFKMIRWTWDVFIERIDINFLKRMYICTSCMSLSKLNGFTHRVILFLKCSSTLYFCVFFPGWLAVSHFHCACVAL